MTRTFDLSSSDSLVPLDVLRELARHAARSGRTWVVVGAAARDLAVHVPLGARPVRATTDVDIAVSVAVDADYATFTQSFDPRRGGRHAFTLMGVELDVVPFGPIEEDGCVLFPDGNRLDVVGLQEAAASPDVVGLEPDLQIPVAPAEVQVVLKLLAWRDRREDTAKDASDLREILTAASEGIYAEEAWNDEGALLACDYMIDRAGPYRFGRLAAERFTPNRSQRIVDLLRGPGVDRLKRDLREPAAIKLEAFRRGFEAGLGHPEP